MAPHISEHLATMYTREPTNTASNDTSSRLNGALLQWGGQNKIVK